MKLRFITDIHALTEAFTKRSGRLPEHGIPILRGALKNARAEGIERIVDGGDKFQVQADKPAQADIDMLKLMREEFKKSGLPTDHVLGNHDIERTGGIKGAAAILGIPDSHYHVDTQDGHRLIVLQEPFKEDPRGCVLFPWSQSSLDFVQERLKDAPTKSVTIFAHTPCDDFDDDAEIGMALRGFDFSNAYRDNGAELRKIMEQSGKNILFVSGHTHIAMERAHKNVRYLTLESPVEKISDANPSPSGRYCDIERNGEDKINITIHGYKPREFSWNFQSTLKIQPAPNPAFDLAAE